MNKKVALIILDGWGYGDKTHADAIANANTPFMDSLHQQYPHATLLTSGEHVGLPDGQMGNSEVGHLNLGAGRVVYQDLVKINKAIEDESIVNNTELNKAFQYAKEKNKAVHFLGLVSDGGIHSHQNHLYKLCEIAHAKGLENVFIHAFTDGRDTDPKSGLGFLERLENNLAKTTGKIASVCGRYYAMDRDKRWERIKLAYDMLIKAEGEKTANLLEAVKQSYANNVTDEFIKPIILCDDNNEALTRIQEGDVVIAFNYRTDRCREITQVLTQENIPEQGMQSIPLYYVTMTNYDDEFKGVKVLFQKDNLKNTLGEVLERAGKKQIRIAETEKYPHVTFFFSGGREKEFKGEKRIMIPSPKVATYDLQPEMSAPEVSAAICEELKKGEVDFVCLNFANPDMVGHTGVYEAIVKAVETVDSCLQKVVEAGKDYSFIIIADHGNADYAVNPDGSPNTAHSKNPVPFILVDEGQIPVKDGKLADVAPTILTLMGIEIPEEMSGEVLI